MATKLEMVDQDYRDGDSVSVILLSIMTRYEYVLNLTRTQVQELLDNFDQDEEHDES